MTTRQWPGAVPFNFTDVIVIWCRRYTFINGKVCPSWRRHFLKLGSRSIASVSWLNNQQIQQFNVALSSNTTRYCFTLQTLRILDTSALVPVNPEKEKKIEITEGKIYSPVGNLAELLMRHWGTNILFRFWMPEQRKWGVCHFKKIGCHGNVPVSYTHLTLPTIYSV